jgi:hypothetical protein
MELQVQGTLACQGAELAELRRMLTANDGLINTWLFAS